MYITGIKKVGLRKTLFISEGFDRLQISSSLRRVPTEDYSDSTRDADGEDY